MADRAPRRPEPSCMAVVCEYSLYGGIPNFSASIQFVGRAKRGASHRNRLVGGSVAEYRDSAYPVLWHEHAFQLDEPG